MTIFTTNADLASAFPSILRQQAEEAVSALPQNLRPFHTFSVRVSGETVSIPQRIYHNPLEVSVGARFRLATPEKLAIIDCLFSRHADGFVREERLRRILSVNQTWIPPFVIQLAGEYVIEILRVIEQAIPSLDRTLYGEFVANNPEFLNRTKQRIVSYWDCYYRSFKSAEYPGFRIQAFLEDLGERKARLAPGLLGE
jgi:hypothetical protein